MYCTVKALTLLLESYKKIKISAFAQLIRDGKITDATSVTAFLLARTKNMFS